ncbi:MAG: FAD-binding oxidoreductase, partial [Rickettsiales bacterium]|nr:FAD-binding oxidoreductase [Rickettsiales bacterium]
VLDMNNFDRLISINLQNCETLNFSALNDIKLPIKKAEIWRGELENFIKNKNFSQKDFENASVECEAGIALGTINYVLEVAEIEIPVDTGAVWVGGGMSAGAAVANASHGTYGLLYGKASDLVLEVNSINGNGEFLCEKREVKPKNFNENEAMINSAKAQYGESAIGTQGTFAVIYQLKFATKKLPKFRHYFLLKLDGISNLYKIRQVLRNNFARNLLQFEIMDNLSLKIIKNFEAENFVNPFFDETGKPFSSEAEIDSKFLLMLQIIGDENDDYIGFAAYDFLNKNLGFSENNIAYSGSDSNESGEEFAKMRHSISGASTKYANSFGKANLNRVSLDLAVPIKHLEAFVNEIYSKINSQNLEGAVFGHIGIGAIHLHIFNKEKEINPSWKQEITEEIFSITKKYNGSCWSEHGIGTANASLYKKFTQEEYYQEWLSYKKKHDPNNILSPRNNGFDKELYNT